MLVIYGILEKYEILIYLVILKKGISILQQYKAVPMSVLTDFPQVLKHFSIFTLYYCNSMEIPLFYGGEL